VHLPSDYSATATAINETMTATPETEAMLAPLTPGSSIFSSAVEENSGNCSLDDSKMGGVVTEDERIGPSPVLDDGCSIGKPVDEDEPGMMGKPVEDDEEAPGKPVGKADDDEDD